MTGVTSEYILSTLDNLMTLTGEFMANLNKNIRKIRCEHRVIYLLMVVFFIKGLMYSIYLIPPMAGASPDDVGHISYIQYIAKEKKLPVIYKTKLENITEISYEEFENREIFNYKSLEVNIEEFDDGNGDNWIAQHPPLYYILLTPVYMIAKLFTNKLYILIIILRIATISLGVSSIYFLNKIMNVMKSKRVVRYTILSIFTFSAPIQFYFSTITNDSLLVFLCILSLYLLLMCITYNINKYYYLFIISCAFICLTKYTGAFVVICYVLFFAYKSWRENGLLSTIKKLVAGGTLGLIILSPIFIRNLYLYGNILQVYDKQAINYHYNIIYFIKNLGYFNEIYSHILTLIGWKSMIVSSNLMRTVVALIISILWFLSLLKRQNRTYQFVNYSIYIIAIAILYNNLNIKFSTSIVIISLILLIINRITQKNITKEKKEIIIFYTITSLIVCIAFMYQHYIIAGTRGITGAMHGRYYYIIIFQVQYLLFEVLEDYENRLIKYTPFIVACIAIFFEIQTVYGCLINWQR
jgi:hypothetical protein